MLQRTTLEVSRPDDLPEGLAGGLVLMQPHRRGLAAKHHHPGALGQHFLEELELLGALRGDLAEITEAKAGAFIAEAESEHTRLVSINEIVDFDSLGIPPLGELRPRLRSRLLVERRAQHQEFS